MRCQPTQFHVSREATDTKASKTRADDEKGWIKKPEEEAGLVEGEDGDGSIDDAGILDVIIEDGADEVTLELAGGTVSVVPEDVGAERVVELVLLEVVVEEDETGTELAEGLEEVVGGGLGIDEEPGIGVILAVGGLRVGEEKTGRVKVVEITFGGALATLDGTEIGEVSLEIGESKSPDIPARVKKGEN